MLTDLRDLVYTRILTKRTALQFVFANDFVVQKTWRPWETLENLADATQYPSGKVYVITGTPGDKIVASRENTVQAEYSVMVGFQHYITDLDSTAEIDAYAGFVEELDQMLRKEIDTTSLDPLWSFSRLSYLRDPDGVPLNFVALRQEHVFESYVTAYYTTVLP